MGIILRYNTVVRQKEENVSDYNWISQYDLYDYEETIIKNGNKDRFHEIISEASVDRLPYAIIMYDVHKKNVVKELMTIYYMYRFKDYVKRDAKGFIPFRNFVDSVLCEYEVKGYKYDVAEIKKDLKR